MNEVAWKIVKSKRIKAWRIFRKKKKQKQFEIDKYTNLIWFSQKDEIFTEKKATQTSQIPRFYKHSEMSIDPNLIFRSSARLH